MLIQSRCDTTLCTELFLTATTTDLIRTETDPPSSSAHVGRHVFRPPTRHAFFLITVLPLQSSKCPTAVISRQHAKALAIFSFQRVQLDRCPDAARGVCLASGQEIDDDDTVIIIVVNSFRRNSCVRNSCGKLMLVVVCTYVRISPCGGSRYAGLLAHSPPLSARPTLGNHFSRSPSIPVILGVTCRGLK